MGKLGQLLVARGWITVQQLTRALKNQNVAGGRLGTCLLEMDAVTEDLLLKGLSEHLGVPAAGIEDLRGIPDEVLQLLPDKLARRCRAIPFRVDGGRLDVALLDPRNLSAQDEIAFASGKRVKVHVSHELRILEALGRCYGEEIPSRFALVIERLNRARFFWERQAAEQEKANPPATAEQLFSTVDDLFAPPPAKLAPPPPLFEPDLPPPSRRVQPAPAPGAAVAAPPRPAAPPPASAPAPAPAPAPPPAPAAPRPLTVSLTAEERVALGTAVPEPTSLLEAEEALAKAGDIEEVGQIVLSFLGRSYRRAALFRAGRDKLTGWMAQGAGVDLLAFGRFSLSFDQPSVFLNLRNGSGFHLGPLPPMPSHRQLAETWGGELPRDAIILPLRLKDRMVTALYADGAAKGIAGVDLEQIQRLAAAATAAFERCAMQQRKRAEAKP
ncbi:MAG TPA: hypothetical protein VLQ45_08795 [Thermoanaerobaculia bacterium]|nr:hypothetical protein [Thermoanaerobaculia bacterium]